MVVMVVMVGVVVLGVVAIDVGGNIDYGLS
jgi:hypothetical protein